MLFEYSHIRIFAIQISRIFFITIYIQLPQSFEFPWRGSFRSFDKGSYTRRKWLARTDPRAILRKNPKTRSTSGSRSLARLLARSPRLKSQGMVTPYRLSLAPIHRNTSCVLSFSFRVAASSPLIPPLREMVTGNSADDGREGFRGAPKYIQTTFTSQIEGNREAPSRCVSAPARKTN